MRTISREIRIDAPPAEVWAVLSDLSRWHEWNPFIREAAGEARAGERLTLRMFPPNGKPMTFRPKVLAAEPGRELRWLGHLLIPGLFDGEHVFALSGDGGGTTLVQSENFKGILLPLLAGTLKSTELSFEALNAALKERVESGAAG